MMLKIAVFAPIPSPSVTMNATRTDYIRRERDWIVEEGGSVLDFFDKTGVSRPRPG